MDERALKPHSAGEHCWWYEDPKSMLVVYEVRGGEKNVYLSTETFRIHYRHILAAMKRQGYLPND